jgi:hypothetical protein
MTIYRVWVKRGSGDTYEDFEDQRQARTSCQDWKNAGFFSWIEEMNIKLEF